MSHVYTGVPNQVDAITIPDDADGENAGTVDVPFQGLMDGQANSNQRFDFLNLNFGPSAALTQVQFAAWSQFERKWWAVGTVGTNDVLKSSAYGGWLWDAATLISGGQLNAQPLHWIDVDPNGNALATWENNSSSILEYTQTTATWTKRLLTPGVTRTATKPPVLYDPIHARWVYIGLDPGLFQTFYSTDRINWTASASTLAAGAGGFNICRAGLDKTNGILIVPCGPNNYNVGQQSIKIGRSTDGGVTMTLATTIVSALAGVEYTNLPRYDAAASKWLLPVHKITGGVGTEIWASTDGGVTWTKIATLSTVAITSVVSVRINFWVGVTNTGAVVFSKDGGVTWSFANVQVTTPHSGIYRGDSGALILGPTEAWPGLKAGAGLAVT